MSNRQIAVFWDLETCYPVPLENKGKSTSTSTQGCGNDVDAGVVVNNIRRAIAAFGSLGSIKAYVGDSQRDDVTRGGSATGARSTKFRLITSARRRLCLSGVQIVEPPLDDDFLSGSSKTMLISDILIHAMDWATKSPIVLITNDVEMSYPMALLRHRQYSVILVASSNSTGYEELKLQSSVFLDWDLDVLRRGPQLGYRSPSYQLASPRLQPIPQESGSNFSHNSAKAPSVSSMVSRQTSNIPEVKRDDTNCSTCHPSPAQSTPPLSPINQPSTVPAVSSNEQPKQPISSVTSVGSGSSGTGWSISDLDGATDIELNLSTPPGWSHTSERELEDDRSRRTPSPETPLVRMGPLSATKNGVAKTIHPSWTAQTAGSSNTLGRMYPPSPTISDTADFITATSSSSQSTLGQRATSISSIGTPAMNPKALPFTPAHPKLNNPGIPTPSPPIFGELTNADWPTPVVPTIPKPSSPAFRLATIADWRTPSTNPIPLKNATTRPIPVNNTPSSSSTRTSTGKARKDRDLSAYKPMVAWLDELTKKGKDEPGRSIVGEMKADKRVLFAKAGVDNYTEYLQSAERLGIIQLGGEKGNGWVKLMPGWKIILGIP